MLLFSIFFLFFTDKQGSTAPISFSERAIEQRQLWSIPTDSLDYPVSTLYLDSLRAMGVKICHTSRWFNGATVAMPDSLAEQINQLDFIDSIQMTRHDHPVSISPMRRKLIHTTWKLNDYGEAQKQLEAFNLPALHQLGYNGQNILLAICDVGFHNFYHLGGLHHEHYQGAVDFTDANMPIDDISCQHGTLCLSTIIGDTTHFRGAATDIDYWLMRTEENYAESPKEPDNLVAAFEMADSLGVNIISVSLGYTMFDSTQWNYTYAIMDGKHTRVARAATIAARKGILLCIAMGNDGNKAWHYLATPADADSILAVGAVDTLGNIGAFSSRGPASDLRVKPDVCAIGVRTAAFNPVDGALYRANGTSLATPLIAGLAACIWSAHPSEPAMSIRERIIQSSSQYDHPDSDYGYGIPNALQAHLIDPTHLPSAGTVFYNRTHKFLHKGHLFIRLSNGKTIPPF